MARVKTVHKSRVAHVCGRDGAEIPKGDSYYTAAPGFRARPQYRCMNHPFRQSELTTSMAAEPMAAAEAFEDQCDAGFASIDDLISAWEDVTSAAQDYLDQREESLSEWEYGNSTLEELRDAAEAALDEISAWEPEEFYEDEPERDAYDDEAEFDEAHEEWEQNRDAHMEEQVSAAIDVLSSVSWT